MVIIKMVNETKRRQEKRKRYVRVEIREHRQLMRDKERKGWIKMVDRLNVEII